MSGGRTLSWDWHPGTIPENVVIDETAYVETSYSFLLFRSQRAGGVTFGRGASTYKSTMFDVGECGRVTVGEFALVHGARIICDAEITIGNHVLISWNVVLMDSYRMPVDPAARRRELEELPGRAERRASTTGPAQPIRIEQNAWIGFDSCILPGVTVGAGAIVGARSVVTADVPPYAIAVGNPARVIRSLKP
jgi:acetyltransferase-like isoleucine patch superfamily enzyme